MSLLSSKDIRISALALLKMVMHARSGGNLEVMGLLLGKVSMSTNQVRCAVARQPNLLLHFLKLTATNEFDQFKEFYLSG